METVTIWQVLTVLVFPIAGGMFALLQIQLNKIERRMAAKEKAEAQAEQDHSKDIWGAINSLREEIKTFQLGTLSRFVTTEAQSQMERRLETRLDTFGAKLDRMLERLGGTHN